MKASHFTLKIFFTSNSIKNYLEDNAYWIHRVKLHLIKSEGDILPQWITVSNYIFSSEVKAEDDFSGKDSL